MGLSCFMQVFLASLFIASFSAMDMNSGTCESADANSCKDQRMGDVEDDQATSLIQIQLQMRMRKTDAQKKNYFWIGISIMLLRNTLQAIGILVQKHAHRGDATTWTCCGCSVALYFTSPTWLCGFVVYVLADGLLFVALALGPQAVLACLLCWATVVTCFLAPIFLGETLTVFRLLSVCIMIFGCCWVMTTFPHVYQILTVDVLLSEMQSGLFQVLSGLALLYLLGCACMAALSNKSPRLSALQYTTVSAILSWYAVLISKMTAGLIFTSWHRAQNQFDRWESWVMIVTMIVLAGSSLHFLNMGLSIGDAIYVVPIYEAIAIFGQALFGGVFFREFQHLDIYGHVNFWLSLSCILLGIICLASQGPQTTFFQYGVLSSTSGESSSTGGTGSPDSYPRLVPRL